MRHDLTVHSAPDFANGCGERIEYINTNWQGETPTADADIALFSFANHAHVELQWCRSQESYVVTLYKNGFEVDLARKHSTANDAVASFNEFVRTVAGPD